MKRVTLLGGPYDGRTARLSRTPQRIVIAGDYYVQITDPDTGEFLGGYTYTTQPYPGVLDDLRGPLYIAPEGRKKNR